MAWSPLSKLITYSKRDLSNSIGNSYANYVEDFLNFYSKTKHFNPTTLDDVIKNETKKADFLIETENYIFVVECKNSSGLRAPFTNSDKEKHPIIDRFNRLNGALEQCIKTAEEKSLFSSGKKIFSFVVVNETVSGEGAAFFLAIYRKLLMSSKIQCGSFSILSISQFENLIISNNLESFAKECEEQFQKINHLTSVEFEDALSALGMKFNFSKSTLDLSFFNLYIKRLGI